MNRTEGKVVCSEVGEHTFKPELDSAQLRMEVITSYPKRQANGDGLFTEDEFNLPSEDFLSTRVAFIDVPKGTTLEEIQRRLDAAPKARIRRTLSLKPILSPAQEAAIKKGLTTLETIAQAQRVCDKDGNPVDVEGKPQYSKKSLSLTGEADEDLRGIATAPAVEEEVRETAIAGG